jgi:hypothetical protein
MGCVWASKFKLTHAGSISCDVWVSRLPCFVDVSEIHSWVICRVICGVGPSGEPLLGREGTRFLGGAVRTKAVPRGMFFSVSLCCSGRV